MKKENNQTSNNFKVALINLINYHFKRINFIKTNHYNEIMELKEPNETIEDTIYTFDDYELDDKYDIVNDALGKTMGMSILFSRVDTNNNELYIQFYDGDDESTFAEQVIYYQLTKENKIKLF